MDWAPPSRRHSKSAGAAASRWRAWYAAIRPLDLEGRDEEVSESQRFGNARDQGFAIREFAAMSTAAQLTPKVEETPELSEPRVIGESKYDRVTSF